MPFFSRLPLRLNSIDYSGGWFFITTCTLDRHSPLGQVRDGLIQLSDLGRIVDEEWRRTGELRPDVELDAFVVMPNHLHAVLALEGSGDKTSVLSNIMAQFKSVTSKRIARLMGRKGAPFWQRGYFDHSVRNDGDLLRIRTYIENNPLQWDLDRENLNKSGQSELEAAWF